MFEILKTKILQYFVQILIFLVVFHAVIRPLQSALNKSIIAPIIVKKLNDVGSNYSLHAIKNHIFIYTMINDKEKLVLHFSMPFGQFYFFLIIFLWFKPPLLIKAISFYNVILIPVYLLAVLMFLNGFKIFGYMLIFNEKMYRMIYFFILSLKILRPKQFKLIFSN